MNEWIYRTEMGTGIEWRITFELHKGTNMGTVTCLGHRKSPEREKGAYLLCAKHWACSPHTISYLILLMSYQMRIVPIFRRGN